MMIREQIKNLIKKVVEIEDFSVEIPEEKAHGDYATNAALILAKKQKKNPQQIAEDLVLKLKIKNLKFLDKVEVVNGFINFFLRPEFLTKQIQIILKEDKNFGKQNLGRGKAVIVDYSSPNIAKPMHVGHLRSTIIGQAIYNIYKFLGYRVIGDNHLGDWGTQFGIMIAGLKKFKSKPSQLKNITIDEMLDIYIRFNKEIEKNPDLQELAKQEFKKLEDGDKENRKIWQILKDKSLEDFNKIYKILGIKFDLILGESFYEGYLRKEIEEALKNGIAKKNPDNSIVIVLNESGFVPFLIQKSDGATLYGTRDLATLRYRIKKYKPEKIIYVIGNEQTFYLNHLFRIAEVAGYVSYTKLYHIKFGLVLDKNHKKLASREGRIISAEDLINKITDLAKKIIKEKNPKLSEQERNKAAQIIGVGALKYNDLSQNRHSDIIFDWKKMLSFEGNSGPYLQYSYVRLRSILRKANNFRNFKPDLLKEKEEIDILKELVRFPEIVREAGEKFQINLLANYLYNLAGLINAFYEKFPVLKAETGYREARLALIKAATIVLRSGLNLLGMEVLEKM